MNTPLAYLITFTCYGTWLHGDKRGSVDTDHNQYGEEILPEDVNREREEFHRLKHTPVYLTNEQRQIIDLAIREVCQYYHWFLSEINVRTNHVHVVVSADADPKKIINDFKRYATRHLRNNNLIGTDQKVWTRGGSRRFLWTEDAVKAASVYVKEQ